MIDIHSHILYGVDDGSSSIEESIEIINQAIDNGVTDIVLTPHYISGSDYISSRRRNKILLTKLKKKVSNVSLYLGNEVFMTDDVIDLLTNKKISTINDTKYMLIEFPIWTTFNNIENAVFQLRSKKIIPIVAHPERYVQLYDNYKNIIQLLEQGALIQCNVASLCGDHGKKVKNFTKRMIKDGCVTFMAVDAHKAKYKSYDKINKAKKMVAKWHSKRYAELIFDENAKKILNNEDIDMTKKEEENIKKKKLFFI